LFKLMAYKDEYEVARLYAETDFLRRVTDRFEGPYRVRFHLAPPLFADRDPESGHLRKRAYGPWVLPAFRILAKLRRVRGTWFDIFSLTEERRTEKRLIDEYEGVLEEVLAHLSPDNHRATVELAALPLEIRGFGHVKQTAIARTTAKGEVLL